MRRYFTSFSLALLCTTLWSCGDEPDPTSSDANLDGRLWSATVDLRQGGTHLLRNDRQHNLTVVKIIDQDGSVADAWTWLSEQETFTGVHPREYDRMIVSAVAPTAEQIRRRTRDSRACDSCWSCTGCSDGSFVCASECSEQSCQGSDLAGLTGDRDDRVPGPGPEHDDYRRRY